MVISDDGRDFHQQSKISQFSPPSVTPVSLRLFLEDGVFPTPPKSNRAYDRKRLPAKAPPSSIHGNPLVDWRCVFVQCCNTVLKAKITVKNHWAMFYEKLVGNLRTLSRSFIDGGQRNCADEFVQFSFWLLEYKILDPGHLGSLVAHIVVDFFLLLWTNPTV